MDKSFDFQIIISFDKEGEVVPELINEGVPLCKSRASEGRPQARLKGILSVVDMIYTRSKIQTKIAELIISPLLKPNLKFLIIPPISIQNINSIP